MRGTLRFLFWLTGALLAGLVAAIFLLPKVLNLDERIPAVREMAERLLGRPVVIEHLTLDLAHGLGVKAHGFAVAGQEGAGELLRSSSTTFVLRFLPFVKDQRIELAGIRLEAPVLRVSKWGSKTSVDDFLARLPREEPQGGLQAAIEQALRTSPIEYFRIDRGTVEFRQYPAAPAPGSAPPEPEITRVTDLTLRFGALRALTPVEFELTGTFAKGGDPPGSLRVEGSCTFRSADYDLDDANVATRVKFQDLDVAWLESLPGWKSLGIERGRLTGEISAIGNPLQHVTAEGMLEAKNFRGRWPSLWPAPLEPKTLRLPFEFERHGRFYEARIRKGDINGMDLRQMKVALAFTEDVPGNYDFAYELNIADVRWEKDFEYFPWNKIPLHLSDQLHERISRVGGCDALSYVHQARHMGGVMHTNWEQTHIEATLSGMTMRVGGGEAGPVIKDLGGKFLLRNGGIYFAPMTGLVDGILPLAFDGGFPNVLHDGKLDLQVTGDVPLAKVATVVPRYAFPAFKDSFTSLEKARGPVTANAHLDFDLSGDTYNYDGSLALQQVDVPLPRLGLDLADLKGDIQFSHERVESSLIRGRSGKSPVGLAFSVEAPQSGSPVLHISFDGADLDLAPIMAAWSGGRGYSSEGRVSFDGLRLEHQLGAGEGARIQGQVQVSGATLTTPFLTQPVMDFNCLVFLVPERPANLGCQGQFGTSDFKISGSLASTATAAKPRADLELQSLYFDFEDLFAHLGPLDGVLGEYPLPEPVQEDVPAKGAPPPSPAAVFANLPLPAEVIRGGLANVTVTANSFAWGNLRGRQLSSSAAYQGHKINFDTTTFEGPGGAYRFPQGTVEFRPGGGQRLSLTADLQDLEAGPFLSILGIPAGSIEGRIKLAGTVSAEGKIREEWISSLAGQIQARAYHGKVADVKKFQVLAQILTLLRWRGIEKYDEGVPFTEISGDFKIHKGAAHTNNLLFESPKFTINAQGKIDFVSQELAMQTVVKVGDPISFALNQSPLAKVLGGKIVLLHAPIPIPIKGSWREPTVRIEPGAEKETAPNQP